MLERGRALRQFLTLAAETGGYYRVKALSHATEPPTLADEVLCVEDRRAVQLASFFAAHGLQPVLSWQQHGGPDMGSAGARVEAK